MAWGANNVSERRQQFMVRASSGKEQMTTLCRELEISRPTGYAWLERHRSVERLQDLAEISLDGHSRIAPQSGGIPIGRCSRLASRG